MFLVLFLSEHVCQKQAVVSDLVIDLGFLSGLT